MAHASNNSAVALSAGYYAEGANKMLSAVLSVTVAAIYGVDEGIGVKATEKAVIASWRAVPTFQKANKTGKAPTVKSAVRDMAKLGITLAQRLGKEHGGIIAAMRDEVLKAEVTAVDGAAAPLPGELVAVNALAASLEAEFSRLNHPWNLPNLQAWLGKAGKSAAPKSTFERVAALLNADTADISADECVSLARVLLAVGGEGAAKGLASLVNALANPSEEGADDLAAAAQDAANVARETIAEATAAAGRAKRLEIDAKLAVTAARTAATLARKAA